jgi:hypothetical protein
MHPVDFKSPFRTGVVTTTERREFATPVFLFEYIVQIKNHFMTTPSSGPISMNDVSLEIGGATPNMNNFYTLSLGGGLGLGQYHNLAMGPGGNLTYKIAVYDPKSIGSTGENLKLENFYNYNQNPNGIFDINLTNSQPDFEVNYQFFLGPTGLSTAPGPPFLSGNLPANGGTYNVTNLDSGVGMTGTNFPDGVYNIYMTADSPPLPPFPPPPPTVTINASGSASDTDNVGAGLIRVNNASAIAFDNTAPQVFIPIVQGNIGAGGAAGTGIFVNKRTTFSLTFA